MKVYLDYGTSDVGICSAVPHAEHINFSFDGDDRSDEYCTVAVYGPNAISDLVVHCRDESVRASSAGE